MLCTPLDDELTYEYKRNPNFWQLTFSSGFKKRLALWNSLNVLRTLCVGLAWVLVRFGSDDWQQQPVACADGEPLAAMLMPREGVT